TVSPEAAALAAAINIKNYLSFRNPVHELRSGLILSPALVASLLPLPTLSSQLLAHIVFRSLYLPALSLSRTSASPTSSHEAMKRSSLVIAILIIEFPTPTPGDPLHSP